MPNALPGAFIKMGRRSNELKHEVNEKPGASAGSGRCASHVCQIKLPDSTKLTKRYASSPNPLIPWLDSTNDLRGLSTSQRGIGQGSSRLFIETLEFIESSEKVEAAFSVRQPSCPPSKSQVIPCSVSEHWLLHKPRTSASVKLRGSNQLSVSPTPESS